MWPGATSARDMSSCPSSPPRPPGVASGTQVLEVDGAHSREEPTCGAWVVEPAPGPTRIWCDPRPNGRSLCVNVPGPSGRLTRLVTGRVGRAYSDPGPVHAFPPRRLAPGRLRNLPGVAERHHHSSPAGLRTRSAIRARHPRSARRPPHGMAARAARVGRSVPVDPAIQRAARVAPTCATPRGARLQRGSVCAHRGIATPSIAAACGQRDVAALPRLVACSSSS